MRKKVAWICLNGLESFSIDIVERLNKFFDMGLGLVSEGSHIKQYIDWADVVWFEWGNEVFRGGADYAAKSKKPCVVRVHSYEALQPEIEKFPWKVPEKIIFVADHIRDIALDRVPEFPREKIEIIRNAVDLDKYKPKVRKPGKNIGVVAYINHKKNPPMWVQIIKKLVDIDPEYKLHIAGTYQDLRYLYYFQHILKELFLDDNVSLHGWVDKEDIPQFWEDKQYVLCTSPHESFGYGVAEAMAMGVKPVIHNFMGARETFPSDCVWNTIDEAVEIIQSSNYDSNFYRKYIEERYGAREQTERIRAIIEAL